MPNNNRRRNSRPKKIRSKRRASGPVPRAKTSTNPLKSLAVTGIRTILAALPGTTALAPIVDMIFSMIGFTGNDITEAKGMISVNGVKVYGLSGMIFPTYANILSRAPQTARNTNRGPRLWFDTPFNDAKLANFFVTARPDNKMGNRSGKWSMAFIPFRNEADIEELAIDYSPLDQVRVQSLPGSVTANADSPLRLSFRPSPEDGYIFQYNKINCAFGALVVAYSDEVRASYAPLTAEEFAPNIQMGGTLKLRQPVLNSSVVGFEDVPVVFNSPAYIKVYFGKEQQLGDKKMWNLSFASTIATTSLKDLNITGGTKYVPKLSTAGSRLESDFEMLNVEERR